MTALPLLALLLAAAPPPSVQAWADRTCAPAHGDSNVELKFRDGERVECLRRAMNRALDRVLLPLEARKAPSFRPWMALQADFNRFVTDACVAAEEASWISLEDNLRSFGTGYGDTERACRQGAYAWRALFAEGLATGDVASLEARLVERAAAGVKAEKAARAYLEAARATAKRAPEKAELMDGMRPVTRAEWQAFLGTLERAFAAPAQLAQRQCALLADVQVNDCERRLAASYWTTLALPDEGA